MKQNFNFKYKPPAMIVFFFFPKIVSSKVVHPSHIYQNTNFHGPTLSGEGFASPQKFERQQICNGCSYSIKNDGLAWHGLNIGFHKMYQLVQKLIRRQTRIDTQTGC
jgi:hypothetical protein